MKVLGRIAMIGVAAALFMVLAGGWARSIPVREGWGVGRQRDAYGRLSRFPSFAGQCVLVVVIGLVGRKVLRIRL